MSMLDDQPTCNLVAYLIDLEIKHSKPTNNDIEDAMRYRDVYEKMRRWLTYMEANDAKSKYAGQSISEQE